MELAEIQSKGAGSPLRLLKAQGLKPVKISEGLWSVPSGSKAGVAYTVDWIERTCTCRDFIHRGGMCKHLLAVQREEEEAPKAIYLGCDVFSEIKCDKCGKPTVDREWAGDDGWICRECKAKRDRVIYFG